MNDETWDIEVSECVKRAGPFVYFSISEDLRHQVAFWKNRRNDCAHAKNNEIHASHIEAFWSFIQSNLPKFVINGGKEALIEKIKNHFNIRLTPRDSDPINIIQEIPYAILEHEYFDFFQELYRITDEEDPFYEDERYHTFWNKLFQLSAPFVNKLVDFLIEQDTFFIQLLNQDPSKVNCLNGRDQIIRQLWYRTESYVAPRVFVALLRNELIPKDQQNEAIKHFVTSSQRLSPEDLTVDEFSILEQKGYPAFFKDIAFVNRRINNFDWANHSKRWMVLWYVKNIISMKKLLHH